MDELIIISNNCMLKYNGVEYMTQYHLTDKIFRIYMRVDGRWGVTNISTLPNTLKAALTKMQCKMINGFK